MTLELQKLRDTLDDKTEEIVRTLVGRLKLKRNKTVYIKDAIPIEGRSGISYLEFGLELFEQYQAGIGRFIYPDQHPLIIDPPPCPVKREVPPSPIAKVKIDIKDDILKSYEDFLDKFCEPGEDPLTYGQTVDCDVHLIAALNERINLGRQIAESKLQKDPSIADITDDELISKLRYPEREEQVIMKARDIATRYEVNPDAVEEYFRWIMDMTIKVEVEYLKMVNS